jgi:hypothetical protein
LEAEVEAGDDSGEFVLDSHGGYYNYLLGDIFKSGLTLRGFSEHALACNDKTKKILKQGLNIQ